MSAGKSRLEKREFVAAIGRFRDVKREQPGYPGIDALIEEARSKQQEALAEAIDGGNRNEQADKLKDARIWFRTALEIVPGSAEAREKGTAVRDKSLTQAEKLWIRGNATGISGTGPGDECVSADTRSLLPDDDLYQRAAKELEALKP